MSEEMIPDVEMTSDVPEKKSLAELVKQFEDLVNSEDSMNMSKEAESIKAAFYKRLIKDKADAAVASAQDDQQEPENPFAAIEEGFKEIYNRYKQQRAEYNKTLDQEREANLKLKEAVVADLKVLIEKQEDVNRTFPEFREIQNRWREIGPVPVQNYRNINDTYQLYVEQFYDMVKINRELRDLDFKKNLEVKEELCQQAEALAEAEDVVTSFRELQKLHEQWKDYGPVAKEFRESIWERFKVATSVINKKYQAYFETIKAEQSENLAKKTALCERVEEIADREISSSNEWNDCSKLIEETQKEWKNIGFASKKDNQKIYDRFRAACDKFYGRKRDFYSEYKDNININLEKKIAICEQAEQLKTSTDWKAAAEQFISLQKQWKEIGTVPRKKADQLWKRFRAACDEFFAERDKNAKPENDFYGNLKAKNRLIEEMNAYELKGDATDHAALAEFQKKWQEIGFVPFKEKDKVAKAYKDAVSRFPSQHAPRRARNARPQLSERDQLILKYHSLQQDLATYENNMGFFAMSKNAEPLILQLQERIKAAKEELASLAERIKNLEKSNDQE